MNPVAVAEFTTAAFVVISIIGCFNKFDKSKATKWLRAGLVCVFFYLIIDALTYVLNGEQYPFVIRYIVNLLSFTLGGPLIILFIKFAENNIKNKTKLDRWISIIPISVTCAFTICAAIEFISGHIFVFENGVAVGYKDYPLYLWILQIFPMVYVPVVAFFRRKELGVKAFILFCIYCVCPILGGLSDVFSGVDISVLCGAASYILLATLLQKDNVRTYLERMNNVLAASNESFKKEALKTEILHDLNHSGKWSFFLDENDNIVNSDVSYAASTIIMNDLKEDGYAWLSIVHPDEREAAKAAFIATIKDHTCSTPYDVTYRMLGRDGVYRWFHSAGRVMRNKDGSGEFFGIQADITEQIEAQLKYQRELQEALLQAKSSSRAKTTFLNNMSHDIRTPMNAVIGYTDIALTHIDEKEKVEDSLNKIKVASKHLHNLINDVLEMSRIEAGELELTIAPVDVREAVQGTADMGQALAAQKDIEFSCVKYDIANPYVFADELHINQICINLISNAIKYTQAGGKVVFSVEQLTPPKDNIAIYRLSVSDNGIGMSEEFQKHIFERFTRERSNDVLSQEGTGLGLSIVKRIVDLCNGSINVDSELGKGSTFSIDIPTRVMTGEEIDDFLESHKTIQKNTVSLKGKRALVVEDNEMNLEIACDILTDAGLVVEKAFNGQAAVKKVCENGDRYYDVILMDIQMPVMNGYDATRKIRELYPNSKLKIIALSANAFEEDKQASLDAGMDDHISKPIKIEELMETLSKNL